MAAAHATCWHVLVKVRRKKKRTKHLKCHPRRKGIPIGLSTSDPIRWLTTAIVQPDGCNTWPVQPRSSRKARLRLHISCQFTNGNAFTCAPSHTVHRRCTGQRKQNLDLSSARQRIVHRVTSPAATQSSFAEDFLRQILPTSLPRTQAEIVFATAKTAPKGSLPGFLDRIRPASVNACGSRPVLQQEPFAAPLH